MVYVDPPQPQAGNIHVRKRGRTRCSSTRQFLPEQWNVCLPSMLESCHFAEVVLSERFLSQVVRAWLSLFQKPGRLRFYGGLCAYSLTQYSKVSERW
jgi:hypothetical protein